MEVAYRCAVARCTSGAVSMEDRLQPIQSLGTKRLVEWFFFGLRGEIDSEWIFADGSYIRAHQHASGARTGEPTGIGTSRGGRTTKIHMVSDAHGNPVDFTITGGQVHDSKAIHERFPRLLANILSPIEVMMHRRFETLCEGGVCSPWSYGVKPVSNPIQSLIHIYTRFDTWWKTCLRASNTFAASPHVLRNLRVTLRPSSTSHAPSSGLNSEMRTLPRYAYKKTSIRELCWCTDLDARVWFELFNQHAIFSNAPKLGSDQS